MESSLIDEQTTKDQQCVVKESGLLIKFKNRRRLSIKWTGFLFPTLVVVVVVVVIFLSSLTLFVVHAASPMTSTATIRVGMRSVRNGWYNDASASFQTLSSFAAFGTSIGSLTFSPWRKRSTSLSRMHHGSVVRVRCALIHASHDTDGGLMNRQHFLILPRYYRQDCVCRGWQVRRPTPRGEEARLYGTGKVSLHTNQKSLPTSYQKDDNNDAEEDDDDKVDEEDLTALELLKKEQSDEEEEQNDVDGNSNVDCDITPPELNNNKKAFDYTKLKKMALQLSDDELSVVFPKGKPGGYYVVKQYHVPTAGFDIINNPNKSFPREEDIARLKLTNDNVTLPVALMLLDPKEYPSFSRARRACRGGSILIHRGPLAKDETTGEEKVFVPERCIRGRVGDRVFPGDVIGKQLRMGGAFYPSTENHKPPFDLPVIYEDDHFAIVNKPAGVVVYSHRKGGHGRMTVRTALPFVLKPPKMGTVHILRRPLACHRLDRPTSGLLIVAKTMPAMIDISRQFVQRKVKKTYTAIVNGIPDEPIETRISSGDAHRLGVDIDPDEDDESNPWQIIDCSLDEKSAVTIWKTLGYFKSLKAIDNVLTLVELKPKTGRYHQLRRHMAWVRERPIIGDSEYDGGGESMYLRGRGLFLCSNKVTLEHPYFNTEKGRKEWEAIEDEKLKYRGGMIRLATDGTDKVLVHASIELPQKFRTFLHWEEERALKYSNGTTEKTEA